MISDTTRIAAGELSQLLGSRLCHDLVSPLGAIGNGVELLEMSPDFPGIAACPELKLIAESVLAARARIQIFRVAFGQVQGDQRIARAGLAQLLDGFSAHGRMQIRLEAEAAGLQWQRTDRSLPWQHLVVFTRAARPDGR